MSGVKRSQTGLCACLPGFFRAWMCSLPKASTWRSTAHFCTFGWAKHVTSMLFTKCLDLLRLIRQMVRFRDAALPADCMFDIWQQAPSFTPKTLVRCVPLAFFVSMHDFSQFLCVQDRSRRCCNVLRSVQALVPHSCPIQTVKQGGQLEIKFHMCLIEDRSVAHRRRVCMLQLIIETFPPSQPHEPSILHGMVGGAWSAEPVVTLHLEIGSNKTIVIKRQKVYTHVSEM